METGGREALCYFIRPEILTNDDPGVTTHISLLTQTKIPLLPAVATKMIKHSARVNKQYTPTKSHVKKHIFRVLISNTKSLGSSTEFPN